MCLERSDISRIGIADDQLHPVLRWATKIWLTLVVPALAIAQALILVLVLVLVHH